VHDKKLLIHLFTSLNGVILNWYMGLTTPCLKNEETIKNINLT
jgi:hypothetical protein